MSCFNDITVGVLTDYEHVDLETRFQMWGIYLWLEPYRLFVRMLCEKQGDEDQLNLPVSYHPYYTMQSFQVGKKKLDVCLSMGKGLTAKRISGIKEQGSILKPDTRYIAYGLQEGEQSERRGILRHRIDTYNASCYQTILITGNESGDNFPEFCRDRISPAMSPLLLAEDLLFYRACEPQTLTEKPYLMLYFENGIKDELLLKNIMSLALTQDCQIVYNDHCNAIKGGIVYGEERLDSLYGLLAGCSYLVTDSVVFAELALTRNKQFTVITGEETTSRMNGFLEHYELCSCRDTLPDTQDRRKSIKKEFFRARKMLVPERIMQNRILEDLLGLTRHADAPTGIRMADCYGCYACKEICPKAAITMVPDEEGFPQPVVNKELCISCGLCEKICIANGTSQCVAFGDKKELSFPLARAAVSKDEGQRASSTSGGVFQSLARFVIEVRGGVVAGARYHDSAQVVTDLAETMEEAKAFSNSKYVKSDINGIYPRIKEQLDTGREVLFSGLPCECAGLKAYLRKDYSNLAICEILCHGGPTPKVLNTYIKYLNHHLAAEVKSINFRDKSRGWLMKDVRLTFHFADREPLTVRGRQNNYMNAFLKNYLFRICCYRCGYTGKNRVGDITIGDFWGINKIDKEMFDNHGTSAILINTEKGENLWQQVAGEFKVKNCTVARIFEKNHSRPSVMTKERIRILSSVGKTPINTLLGKYNPWKEQQSKDTDIS